MIQGGKVDLHVIYIKFLCHSNKPNFCGDIECIFINIIFPKERPIWFGLLHWPPKKLEFIEYLDKFIKRGNICNIQVSYC